jgi:hypothetical protein
MKAASEHIVDLLPAATDFTRKEVDAVNEAIHDFVRRFP